MSVYRTIGPLVLFLIPNIDCGYPLERFECVPTIKVLRKYKNNIKEISTDMFPPRKFYIFHDGHVFVNELISEVLIKPKIDEKCSYTCLGDYKNFHRQ